MTEQNDSSGIQVENDKNARHLVSLPTILLTRIDKNTLKLFESQNVARNKSLNRVILKKKMASSPVKPRVKNLSSDKLVNRTRGRPKKEVNVNKKSQKIIKKSVKPELTSRPNKTTNKPKLVSKPQVSTAKSILKKTMLQKISKVAIPQVKKSKLVKKTNSKQSQQKLDKIGKKPQQKLDKIGKKPQQKLLQFNKQQKLINNKQSTQKIIKSSKQTSQKIIAPEIKNVSRHKNTTHTDSSEDEFLYDQLIGHSENISSKYIKTSERTTNITLKPSKGNRPPTIVKGGIIKIDNLPADLKTIASPGQQQLIKSSVSDSLSPKKAKLPQTGCPIPPKRPSPWPISISSPPKVQNNVSPGKKRSIPNNNSIKSNVKQKITGKQQQKPLSAIKNHVSSKRGPDEFLAFETQQNVPITKKHKFGPKLLIDDEESLSDEYTEVETLEGLDDNENYSVKTSVKNPHSASKKSAVSSVNTIRDDEDPNLDLLRILTDETEDCTPKQYENPNLRPVTKENKPSPVNAEIEIEASISLNECTINGSSPPEDSFVELKKNEEPKVRTIYDLINEVSLQRPSWNLHIIPETNAFCIAQVTKGRLGLPTLKKCIELDPEDYNAKVYIHQYHIKRFDGIYDSEESILNLIEEIDSIKA